MKAEEHLLPLKLGKKLPKKVEKLINHQKEQKQELEKKEAHIKDLESRLDQKEQKESESVAKLENQLEEAKMKLCEAHGEIQSLRMNQANYEIMLKTAKDHRDEECENLRCNLNSVLQGLTSGAKLDPKIIEQVKVMTAETPNPSGKESEQQPLPQQQAQ